jgi:group I intron endonuclease
MKKNAGIYKITSPSGKVYIGQSWNIKVRWWQHGQSNHTPYLFSSITKYGKDNHKFEVIHHLPFDCGQSTMNQYEQLYMDLYKGCGITLLNLKEGGSNGRASEESKRKISEALKGRPAHNKGKKHSEETKQKISRAGLGKKSSPKTVAALIKRNQQRKGQSPPNKGKKMSDEQKRKLSEVHKGRKLTPESIAKRTKSFLERLTPESRQRRSETMKNNNANIKKMKLSLMINQINLFNAIS